MNIQTFSLDQRKIGRLDLKNCSSSLRILALGPHPDDFDAVAVTLRHFHANGNPIDAAILTLSAIGVEDAFDGAVTNKDKERIRESEQLDSLHFFGLPPQALHLVKLREDQDGYIENCSGNADLVCGLIENCAPDIIFLPHRNDTNPDHRRTWRFAAESARRLKKPLAVFQIRDPKTTEIEINLVTPFDEKAAEWKGAMLRHHRSQHARNLNTRGHGFDERILSVNQTLAQSLELDAQYTEAFEFTLWPTTV